ncbi:MAG: ADP-glyceromanno-heptose 6-epimerase, partial [Gemmatimonadetes bacterium]
GEVEAIVHMGAVSSTTETDADLIAATNVRLPLALWEWCAREGVRFIYASSAATYGDGSQGFDDDPDPGSLARLRPLNPYGWSKQLFDRMVARRVAEGRPAPPQWAGLKFFNVYGPNEYHKGSMRSVALQAFEQIRERGAVTLFRSHHPDYVDGGQLRDFVWVGDCVEVVAWLLGHPGVSGLFNVGTGRARSFLDLAHAVFAALGREPRIEWVDTPAEIRERYQYFTEARMERLRAAGYDAPFTGLEEGVVAYVRDYLATDDPYR